MNMHHRVALTICTYKKPKINSECLIINLSLKILYVFIFKTFTPRHLEVQRVYLQTYVSLLFGVSICLNDHFSQQYEVY